ncbi:hypothetical protein [Limnovirga soli]|uniref:Uncharacterized protein n=1 Tax=Limnovirga soli TaxID=2656915 RepID=A0A8J8F9V8_9BACT|nr:hypothetical protein [Limnovirga soli]NNV54088.1 hypothetical protein [Limnovirga soli]
MKLKICLIALIGTSIFANAQSEIDSALAKKITVSGFCLCKSTIEDLRKLSIDFKPVEVEEMDMGKRCMGGDSRYVNEKGYASEKYPGLIFQKDPDEDYISKIRLTKDFVGLLPDETHIDMHSLLLKDVLKLYPEFDSNWHSRDCSDYWTLSNDTISFYVKIDKNKTPQYPIDEAYYLERPVDGIDIFISCYSIYHKSEAFNLFEPDEPVYFLDSIRVNQGVLKYYKPSEIALVSVYKDSTAIKLGGEQAKNGLIYITTKAFARDHYRDYFKSKSTDYTKAAANDAEEEKAIYILNGKVLTTNIESDLFYINDSNFVQLIIIDKGTLKKNYHVSTKSFGVIITTK